MSFARLASEPLESPNGNSSAHSGSPISADYSPEAPIRNQVPHFSISTPLHKLSSNLIGEKDRFLDLTDESPNSESFNRYIASSPTSPRAPPQLGPGISLYPPTSTTAFLSCLIASVWRRLHHIGGARKPEDRLGNPP